MKARYANVMAMMALFLPGQGARAVSVDHICAANVQIKAIQIGYADDPAGWGVLYRDGDGVSNLARSWANLSTHEGRVMLDLLRAVRRNNETATLYSSFKSCHVPERLDHYFDHVKISW